MIEYKLISMASAHRLNLPGAEDYDAYYDDYLMGIWKFVDDEVEELLAKDGGEPEDNSFGRDGAWITPALNAAYEEGRKDGWDSCLKQF